MDITLRNFPELFPFIRKSVESADFISFDFEFSGLNSCQADKTHNYDNDKTWY